MMTHSNSCLEDSTLSSSKASSLSSFISLKLKSNTSNWILTIKKSKTPSFKKLSKLRNHKFNLSQIILLNSLKDSANWNKSIATPRKESKWWKTSLYSTIKSSSCQNYTNTQKLSKLLKKFRLSRSSLETERFISCKCFTAPLNINFQSQHFMESVITLQVLWLFVRLNSEKKSEGTILWFGRTQQAVCPDQHRNHLFFHWQTSTSLNQFKQPAPFIIINRMVHVLAVLTYLSTATRTLQTQITQTSIKNTWTRITQWMTQFHGKSSTGTRGTRSKVNSR